MKHQHSPASTASLVHRKLKQKGASAREKEFSIPGKKSTRTNTISENGDIGVSLAIYVDTQCYDFIKAVMSGHNTLDLPMHRSEAVRYIIRLGMAYIKTLIARDKDVDKDESDKILKALPALE